MSLDQTLCPFGTAMVLDLVRPPVECAAVKAGIVTWRQRQNCRRLCAYARASRPIGNVESLYDVSRLQCTLRA